MRAKSTIAGRLGEYLLLSAAILLSGVLLYTAYGQFYRAAYPVNYQQIVLAESNRRDLPPSLVFAVIRTESGFRPNAQSSVRARGLMQITEETFQWAQMRTNEQQSLYFDDLFNSELNIRYGAAILRLLLDEFGTYENALCAYHAGWGKAKEWLADAEISPDGENIEHIPYGDTARYVHKVMETQKTYEVLYGNIA